MKSISEQYDEIFAEAERFRLETLQQIDHLVRPLNAELARPIESRVKTLESILEKEDRKGSAIGDVHQLSDLIGFRVVVLFKRDLDALAETIEKNLSIVNAEDVSERLKSSQFGYQSIHYEAQVPSAWRALPTFRDIENFKFEIQLRTLTQHIWATASHKLQYKNEQSVPTTIQRSINRVAALLETVDLEFERVLSERTEYRDSLERESSHSNRELDVDVIEYLLSQFLPGSMKKENEDYSDLLGDLTQFEVRTYNDLESLIKEYIDAVLIGRAIVPKLAAGESEDEEQYNRPVIHQPIDGAFSGWTGLVRDMLRSKFGEKRFESVVSRSTW